MIENLKMFEEELKSEAQDDIGGEFSLFPCCKQCENPEKLFSHIKQHHEKDATKCALCGKELSSKSSLDRHLLIHAKWQPYRCNHCNKQFSTNGNMHRHKKTHKGLCKGSKFVREELKSNKDCSSLKKPKKNLKYGVNLNLETEEMAIISNDFKDSHNGKRKMNAVETMVSEISAKRSKSQWKDKNMTSHIESYPLSPDSEPDLHPLSGAMEYSETVHISSPPTKEEFITTLGLKTACRLETKAEPTCTSISRPDSLIGHLETHKDVSSVVLATSVSDDDEKKQCFSEKNLVEFNQNQFLNRPNVTVNCEQIQLGLSDPPFREKTVSGVPEDNVDRAFNNTDWLPESPETSTGENYHKLSTLICEFLKDYEGDKLQPQYSCEQCKKEFKNKIIFQKHLIKHNKRKPFKCTLCDAKLLSKQNATRHVVKVHKKRRMQAKLLIVENLDETPSAGTKTLCEWCGQEFTSSLILEHHKRASTGCQAKPFICLICNKSFSTKNNGKRHQFKHHKEEQIDCCIVRNIMANNNEGKSLLPKTIDASTSSNSIRTVDSPQDSSIESLLSSESEHLHESEHFDGSDHLDESEHLDESKHSEESGHPDESRAADLDAAQSLLKMLYVSPHPPRSSSDETIKNQPDTNSSSLSQDNSFDSSIPIHLTEQNRPLDLSVHPMDLSSKSNGDADRLNAHKFKHIPIFTFPASPNRSMDTGIFHVSTQIHIPSETPLNLVKRKDPNLDNHLNFTTHAPISFPSNLFDSNNHSPMEIEDTRQKESNSPKSPVSYECNLCSMSFSTNSNKRRHEKTKHLMHCKVPQSPKNSSGFFNSKDKHMTSTPKSVLSKKTKEALITKVNSLKSVDFEPVDFSVNNDSAMIHPLAIISNESENGDLASVSSLINTANSPQLKKFLTADHACDATASVDDAPPEVKEDPDLPKSVDQTSDTKKGSNKHWCSVCQKQFTCKSSFNRHSVIHTKKRDHHCQECKKTFTTKSNRDRHMKKVHRLILSSDSKKLLTSKKQQKKSVALVPSESFTIDMDVKDLTLPKEVENSEISQCNKENQRLFMRS